MFDTGHTLKLITTTTNKKYLILTFPPNLDTKSVSKSFLINVLQRLKIMFKNLTFNKKYDLELWLSGKFNFLITLFCYTMWLYIYVCDYGFLLCVMFWAYDGLTFCKDELILLLWDPILVKNKNFFLKYIKLWYHIIINWSKSHLFLQQMEKILICMLHLTNWVCDQLSFSKDELISWYWNPKSNILFKKIY